MLEYVFDTPEALGLFLARLIHEELSAKRHYVLGCPGGRSPQPVYQALGKLVATAQTDLSGLIIAMMDD